MVQFRALGGVSVTHGDDEVNVGGSRQRRLLAMLLINRNTVVSVDRLADAVFAGEPTPAAATTLRSYVARMRRVIESEGPGPSVVTQAPGYVLRVEDDAFDVARFEAALVQARSLRTRGEPAEAARTVREALASWRGDAYAEFADEDWAWPESQRLAEVRLVAHELVFDAELDAGRTAEVIPELEAMAAQHPLREAFVTQLMTALYRAGRQADALRAYRRHREVLVEELGLDPTPALQEFEQRVLANDPDLRAREPGEALRGYRLRERLGTGRDGTVHVATLPGVERELVLRAYRAEVADDPAFVRSFEATAHRLASLRHPAIVPIHDYWREPGAAYLVMRRMTGGSLADRLERRDRPPMGADEAATIVRRLEAALRAAHDAGIAHGPITPTDVLFDDAGHAYLADFDLRAVADPAADAAALDAFVREHLAGAEDVPTTPEGTAPNPYKGLRAFEEGDADDFFGRTRLIDQLVDRLSGDGLRGRLLLVVGGSGTGKSSVVRAGLLPRVRCGDVPGSDRWFVTTMLPGATPFKELAAALRRVAVVDVDHLAERLAEPGGLHRLIGELLPGDEQLLLVVDQLEELFTSATDADQRRFLDALMDAIDRPASRLRVVATLRADFYDRPLAIQPIGDAVAEATVTVPALTAAELESAIVEPAARTGRRVEGPLLVELVSASIDEPAGLPALQFTLFELADRCPGDLTVAAYRELGGLIGAIASRAEDLYRSLDDDERRGVRRLFEQLVVVNPDGEPTRRRAMRSEVLAVDPALDALIDRWAEARLLTLDHHRQTRLPTVEPAHEALLREWPRLRRWLDENRESLVVLGRLREDVVAWEDLDRDAGALYRGSRLQLAVDVLAHATLGPQEQTFLDASLAAREEEEREAAAAAARTQRSNRRLRRQLVVIGVALVAALAGALVAVDQRGEAVAERRIAFARELAAEADANIDEDPERAILLAMAAIDVTRNADGSVRPEAVAALHRAISRARVVLDVPGLGGALDWSPDGSVFLTEGPEETGVVDVRDAETGESVHRFVGHEVDINEVAFSADGSMFATAGDDERLRVWDTATGDEIQELWVPAAGSAWAPAFSPDGRFVAGAWLLEGIVAVFDLETGELVARVDEPAVHGLTFDPAGERLVVSSVETPGLLIVDARTGVPVDRWGADTATGRDARFSPDGRLVASVHSDGAIRVWDASTGQLRFTSFDHAAEVNAVDWSPDGTRLATGSGDGTVRLHELAGDGLVRILSLAAKDTANGVGSVAFSPDGTRVMAGDWEIASVKVWDVTDTGGAELTNVRSNGYSLGSGSFLPDGSLVATDPDGTVSRWDVDTGRRQSNVDVGEPPDAPTRLAPSPDGGLLAVGLDDGVAIREVKTGRRVAQVPETSGSFVRSLAWSPDGEHLAINRDTDDRGVVTVVDRAGTVVVELREEAHHYVIQAEFADDDTIVTSRVAPRQVADAEGIQVWDWRSEEVVSSIRVLSGRIAVDRSNGLVAATRQLSGDTAVFDLATGERRRSVRGPSAAFSVAYSADGARLAVGFADGSIRVWDAASGRLETALRGHERGVESLSFSPDDRRMASLDEGGLVRTWELDVDALLAIARSRLTRELDDDECRQFLRQPACERSGS